VNSFAARMREAKLAKKGRRDRGASIGDHRGQLKPRTGADLYRGYDEMEISIAALVDRSVAAPWCGFANDLEWIVRELNDPTILEEEIPF
jgi:hypothetical protein